ncbi:MAG: AsmA-like C-terminal domain-containing protein [Alphaproteobacteria bacterium]|nr:AsmA-like C-terminal domain-containing protein [Alphaproteobacteria bacterium]
MAGVQGQGLAVTEVEVAFTRLEGVVSLMGARANGVSLGFTASGKIYSYSDIVDIEGTLVPAYAINSVLGNIPVLGKIFSGGEKGGGIFAATYKITGPTESPKIEVNPLSVLAPGFLRKLFGFLEGREDVGETPNN